jgi:hypothetical protein
VRRDRAAIDDDERAARPRTLVVQRLRHDLLPVPVSPSSRTVASLAATRSSWPITRPIADEWPTSWPNRSSRRFTARVTAQDIAPLIARLRRPPGPRSR